MSDLRTVVNQFLTVSGRWDLMPPSFQEEGGEVSGTVPLVTALSYINAGVGLLEQLCPNENQVMYFLPGQDCIIVVPRGRYVRKMWVGQPNAWALLPRNLWERLSIFSAINTKHLPIDIETGKYMDVIPDTAGLNHIAYKIFAQVGGNCIKITGAFHPEILQEPDDNNYWCTTHPMLVTYAALYQLETAYRNREGAAAWLDSVMREVKLIDYDKVFDTAPEGWNYE